MLQSIMLKRLIVAISLFFLSFLWPKIALAQTEFLTDYIVNYTVNSNGQTHAELNISLVNTLSNIYAKEFTLSIGSTQLSDIRVANSSGNLNPSIVQGNKTTNITISFPEKVLGKDKTQNFTIEFNSADFSHRLGNVWEISIPRLSKNDNLRSYQLILAVPRAFGPPSTITPSPVSIVNSGSNTVYRFNQEEILAKGISATFGSAQFFDFQLQYHLQNSNFFPIKTEIALPPDTAWQTIIYQTLKPRPESINVDEDGNWLAAYLLNSKENLTVTATGSAEIFLQPQNQFLGIKNSIVDYLSKQKYWETDNPKIIKLADQLKTPKNIYQFLVDNLIYDYGRITEGTTRFGAANALDNPNSAICMEFTDLFVALSRSAGIPSRAVNGYAYTSNPDLRPLSLKRDLLHAWPEYFDPEKDLWIPVDPTWGNTTGGVDFFNHTDLNHFTFVILGKDSQYPVPAGAYKTDGQQTQDIQVEFGLPQIHRPQTTIEFKLPATAIAGMPLKGELVINNIGNVSLYNQTVNLTGKNVKFSHDSWKIPVLLPFTSQTFYFELAASGWNDNYSTQLLAQSEFSQTAHLLTVKPVYLLALTAKPILFIVACLILLTGLFFLIKKLYNNKKL